MSSPGVRSLPHRDPAAHLRGRREARPRGHLDQGGVPRPDSRWSSTTAPSTWYGATAVSSRTAGRISRPAEGPGKGDSRRKIVTGRCTYWTVTTVPTSSGACLGRTRRRPPRRLVPGPDASAHPASARSAGSGTAHAPCAGGRRYVAGVRSGVPARRSLRPADRLIPTRSVNVQEVAVPIGSEQCGRGRPRLARRSVALTRTGDRGRTGPPASTADASLFPWSARCSHLGAPARGS